MFRSVIKRYDRLNSVMVYVPCRTAKHQLPFTWERPVKVPNYKPEKSGDLQALKEINVTQLPGLFNKSEELKTADENVKRLFSIEFQKGDVLRREIRKNYMESVKRHNFDDSSPEAKIASITGIIRYLQIIIDTYKDKTPPRHLRVYLKELVEKRSKRLRKLRLADYKLFEWVIENLDLIHKARPTPNPEKVERKKSLRRLTDLYCDTLRQERLDQYRDHLESQHEKFLQEKLETLQWIQNKEKECGINLTVSDEEIECVSEELEKVKKLNKQKIVEED